MTKLAKLRHKLNPALHISKVHINKLPRLSAVEKQMAINDWANSLPAGYEIIGFEKASPVIGKTIVAGPGVGCTGTFITVGSFETEKEALNCQKYLKTKFARMLLSVKKVTQHNAVSTWESVPLQDFTDDGDINWDVTVAEIDRQLYKKYGLSPEEVIFIETHIKAME